MGSDRVRMVLGGVRRFVLLTVVIIVAAALVSAIFGTLLGEGLRRSVTVGLYLTGSILVVLAFFVSTRPPARADGDGDGRIHGPGSLFMSMSGTARFTTPQERRDSQAISWLLVCIGLVVVIVAAVADGRHALI